MEIEIRVTKSNGQYQSAVSDLSRFSDAYLLMDTVVDIRETSYDGEYVIYIQPVRDIALKKIEISVNFDYKGAYIFDSGATGRSYAGILSADVPLPFSRDVFMAANCDTEREGKFFFLNLGFTSFERFFTYFTYSSGCISAVYDLENRTISSGTILRLENIMIDDTVCAQLFLESVAESIALKQKIKERRRDAVCWYSGTLNSDEPIGPARASEISKSLHKLTGGNDDLGGRTKKYVLLDGWQTRGKYSCELSPDIKLFPKGPESFSDIDPEGNTGVGIVYAPGLISDDSVRFKDYNYRLYNDRNPVPSFANVYPMTPGSQDVQNETYGFIKTAAGQWSVSAIMLDRLDALLFREDQAYSRVSYQRDYSVALLRNLLKGIRRAAGDDLFLIGSGPVGECAGVVDGMTISDGTPSGADWKDVRSDVLNMIYRSFYNDTVFRTFSRGYAGMSEDEARLMIIAAAFSGGAFVLGGDPESYSDSVRTMLLDALPPSGIATKPLDFWEYPYCTHTVASVPDKSVRSGIHVLYNFDDFDDQRTIKVTEPSIFVDMLSRTMIASGRSYVSVNVKPHSAFAVLVKQMPEFPALLWTSENIYCGCMNTSDLFFSDTLIITSDAPPGTVFYIYVPYGRSGEVYVNDRKVRLDSLSFTELGEGAVFAYVL